MSKTHYNLREIFDNCESKRKKHLGDYPGENSDLPGLINFTDSSDLFKIILHANLWEDFRKFFGRNDSNKDNFWRNTHWKARESLIVHRVRHLMNHSNPDLIRLSDRYTFKGFCGEILEICQTIETVLLEQDQQLESELPLPNAMDRDQEGTEQEKGEQEELYEGTVWAILSNGNANVGIDEYSILQSKQFVEVPECDFQRNAFKKIKGGTRVKFKVKKTEQGFRVYDVSLAESE